MREATIRDVAREAGVSISTVSKVLNQKGRVGTQTIEHVRKVAEKLNYTPNSIAVSMVVKKSNLIAVMVPDIITDFYAQVIQGVEEAAREIGLSTIIVNTDARRENEYGLLYGRIGKLVDGVVAIPSVNDRQIYAAFDKPIVFVDRLVDDAGIDSIVIDNYNGAHAATRYLIGKGHRRIGFISAGLNYTPNSIAVSMVVKKSNLIAVMVPDIITDFYAQVIQGVEEAAREIGLSTIIVNTDARRENEYGLLYGRIGKLVDGVVAIPSVNDRQIYAAFDKPIVFVDRLVDDAGIDSIVIDNYNGAHAATRYLIGKGHRRIGFISAGLDINVGKERYLGYAQALRDFKIAENRDYVYFGDWHEATGQRAVEHFSALKQPPTALFAANCNICIGVLKYCSGHAVKIGADYSLIGFDDHLLAHYASPKVTVVSRPTIEMGHQAVAMLESRMTPQGRRESRKKIVLPVKLVERDSVSAVSDESK